MVCLGGNIKRRDLIDFSSYFKINTYGFASKDDPYHREKWFEMYPDEDLDEIDMLAKFAENRAIDYYWTIAPFLQNEHRITEENKAEGLNKILEKFEQLYSKGIRCFGVLGDDVGGLEPETVIFLLNSLNQWRREKGDVKELIFCPHAYCMEEWAFRDGGELNLYDEYFDEDIHIIYTGINICSPINKENIEAYKTTNIIDNERRRDPLFWMNWPVNDIDHQRDRRLFMGAGEVFAKGKDEITGVLTNPMEQAEASKVAVFASADYAWNPEFLDAFKSWEDSFQYIDANAAKALYEIAKHLSSQEKPAAYPDALESELIREKTENFRLVLENHSFDKSKEISELKAAFQDVLYAIFEYREKYSNVDLYLELEQFVNSLEEKAQAGIKYLEAFEENSEIKKAEADALLEKSKNHKIDSLTKNTLYANPGVKVIKDSLEFLRKLTL